MSKEENRLKKSKKRNGIKGKCDIKINEDFESIMEIIKIKYLSESSATVKVYQEKQAIQSKVQRRGKEEIKIQSPPSREGNSVRGAPWEKKSTIMTKHIG